MAHIIQIRQRIKAIKVIKKVTHAMRLISMSTHSRLKNTAKSLTLYTQELHALFSTIKQDVPTWSHRLIETHEPKKPVIILISSQKGLCRNFDNTLFSFFNKEAAQNLHPNTVFIAVGKKAAREIKKNTTRHVAKTLPLLSSQNIFECAQQITDHLIKNQYDSVICVSNKLQTFFIQKPSASSLIPLEAPKASESESRIDYAWEQPPESLLDGLVVHFLKTKIHELLFQSLLAEQAARFIAMDNSTRNAKKLLEEAELQYNKLRQAKITREITELTAHY